MNAIGGEPKEASDMVKAVAEGDLSIEITAKPGDQTSIMANLQAMQLSLSKVVSDVRLGSESVATASAEIAQGNMDLSARTESQASALEETAASMEELMSTVKQNADNAKQANQLARSASLVASQGGEVVAQAVGTMREISESSVKIADTQMDEATQQNAALVEEMAAAASTLKFQAVELVQTVSVFKMISGADDVKRNPNHKDSKRINFRSERDLVLLS